MWDVRIWNVHIWALVASVAETTMPPTNLFGAERFAGLRLKPDKCVLVPTGAPFSTELEASMRAWLIDHVPGWSGFKIASAGKYLGFYLGPNAKEFQWKDVTAKWKGRCNLIGRTHAAASISVAHYNTRCVPLLMYKMQLLWLPSTFMQAERVALQHILHMATNSLDHASFFHLGLLGGPDIISTLATNAAVLMRSGLKTFTNWRPLWSKLQSAFNEHLSLADWHLKKIYPSWWSEPPMVFTLAAAANGFPALPLFRCAGAAALSDKLNASTHCTIDRNYGRLPSTQSIAYKRFKPALYNSDFVKLFRRRLYSLFPDFGNDIESIMWPNVFAAMRSLSMHQAMTVVKTLANAWTTTRRYHEEVRWRCIFGCPGCMDELQHYVVCIRLRRALFKATKIHGAASPIAYLGLLEPCQKLFLRLGVMFTTYHALRSSEKPLIMSRDIDSIAKATLSVACNAARAFALSQ